MNIKYLSVCSGIEAASVAFHPLGWEAVAFSEIEAFPCAVLAHHYPTVPNLGDMTKWKSWDWELLAEADVLVGGPPCQAFSVAGLRAGLDDERGQLTISYIHLLDHIDEVRKLYGKEPAICLYENVPGILSSKDNAFGAFLGGLVGEDCELLPTGNKWTDSGCVYGPKRTVAWRILDAQYFGVAQRRKRVFVIASARDIDPSEILFEFDGVRRDTPPSRETGKSSTEAVGGSSEKQGIATAHIGRNSSKTRSMGETEAMSPTLMAEQTPSVAFEPGLAKRDGSDNRFSEEICGTLRAQMGDNQPAVAYSIIADPTPKVGDDICLTMRSQGGGGEIVPAVYREGSFGQYNDDGTFATIKASGGGSESFVTIPIHDKATRHGGERGVSNGLGIGSPTDPCPTLDTGGNHALAIQGSMIGRDDKNGPQGDGLNEEVSFTLNCVDRHAIAFHHDARACQLPSEGRDTSISDSLTCSQHAAVACIGGHIPITAVAFAQNTRDEVREMAIVGALAASPGMKQTSYIREQMQVRRITPTECERLQGFPDGWTDVPYRNKPAADGPRYKSLGNSMAVPVMNFIGRRINNALTRLGN